MLLGTWNVNSIRVREQRLGDLLERHRPDILCLQELKVTDDAFPQIPLKALGYHTSFHGQKSYNGVAILSHLAPDHVSCGVGDDSLDEQARLIRADFGNLSVLSAYFPNGSSVDSDKYEFKLSWMKRLRTYIQSLVDEDREVILAGDFNVAVADDDMADLKYRKTVLANDEVRNALAEIRAVGLQDCCEDFFSCGHVYTWWDYRGRSFDRDHGMRIDHIYATAKTAKHTIGATVDRKERAGEGASDHAPVFAKFQL